MSWWLPTPASAIEQRQFGHRRRRRFDSEHYLAAGRRGAEGLHAALRDQEHARTRLAFPQQHVAHGEALFDGALHEPATSVSVKSAKRAMAQRAAVFGWTLT
jgi:hypothetical protein